MVEVGLGDEEKAPSNATGCAQANAVFRIAESPLSNEVMSRLDVVFPFLVAMSLFVLASG